MMGEISGVYLITNAEVSARHERTIFDDVKTALDAGVKIIQYREKKKPYNERREEAIRIGELIGGRDVLYIINDDLALAIDPDVQADGLHVGQIDLQKHPLHNVRRTLGEKMLGVTVRDTAQALEAIEGGANYVSLGSLYLTKTKRDVEIVGIGALQDLVSDVRRAYAKFPIVAIGGITEHNIDEVLTTGVDSVAMISAILDHQDVAARVRLFHKKVTK